MEKSTIHYYYHSDWLGFGFWNFSSFFFRFSVIATLYWDVQMPRRVDFFSLQELYVFTCDCSTSMVLMTIYLKIGWDCWRSVMITCFMFWARLFALKYSTKFPISIWWNPNYTASYSRFQRMVNDGGVWFNGIEIIVQNFPKYKLPYTNKHRHSPSEIL